MIRVDLPYPHKLLWPNGPRGNVGQLALEKRKHRRWAHDMVMADPDWRRFARSVQNMPHFRAARLPVHIVVSRKAAGVFPDNDNTVAAAKAYLDGIADRLGINDKLFAAPTVEFVAPITARFVIQIGGAAA